MVYDYTCYCSILLRMIGIGYDLIYRVPILGRGVFYQMVYTACLLVCGMSAAYIFSMMTSILEMAGMSFLIWLDGAFDSVNGGL